MAEAGHAKYRPYPAYKPSGVEWLGDIPERWGTLRVKLAADFRNDKRSAKNSDAYVGLENVVPWVGEHTPTLEQDVDGLSLAFSNGDVLFGKLRPYLAKSWRANFDGVCSSEFLVLVSRYLEPKFLNYVTLTADFINQVDSSTYGSKMPRANSEFIGQLKIPYPSSVEATQIAAFLDHETAKIDGLIAKQQRLIALLEEKRQAVISHAVTKGLDPTAPLRPSGIDWLGDVPEHWELSQFGYISEVVRGGSPRPAGDPTLFNGSYSPWVTVAEITKDNDVYLHNTDTCLTRKGSDQCRIFAKGTLLLSNSGASLGVPKILQIDANANDGVLGFENLTINPVFAYYYLSTLTGFFRDSIKSTGGSTQINLNTDILKKLPVPVPPTSSEQREIVSYIEERIETFRSLTTNAQSAMSLLKERRTALISAAVTGKIDLRDWQPPASATARNADISKDEFA